MSDLVPPATRKAYFGFASCAVPFLGALAGLIPAGRVELVARVLIGILLASAVGMLCAAIAVVRRERPWWVWLIGLGLNAYPFIFFLLGISVLLGMTRIHL